MDDALKALVERFSTSDEKPVEHAAQLVSACFSSCGRWLFGGGMDSRIHCWQVAGEGLTAAPPAMGHHGWVTGVVTSQDRLFSSDSWGSLQAFHTQGETLAPAWKVAAAHDGWIQGLAVSGEGKWLATTCAQDLSVGLWDAATGQQVRMLNGHAAPPLRAVFHPDGKSLLTGDLRGIVCQWDVGSFEKVRTLDASVLFKVDRLQDVGGVHALQVSPSGRWLGVGGTKPSVGGNVQGIPTLLVFDWASGQLHKTLELGTSGDVYVADFRFHDDVVLMVVTSGNPGSGKLLYRRIDDTEPFYTNTKMANCHSLSLQPAGDRLAIVTARAGNGNGRQLDKDGQYPGNTSPIYVLRLPKLLG